MRAVVERVESAQVTVDGAVVGRIDHGLLVYLGIAPDDGAVDVEYLADKIRFLRIFQDSAGKLNRDVVEAGGAILAISAFTTMADARKGRRPSFDLAARPESAEPLYAEFCDRLAAAGVRVERGRFRAMMRVTSANDGPICILLDSRRAF